MKKIVLVVSLLFSVNIIAQAELGKMAPNFTLDGHPQKVSLESLKGQIVVLEWFNHGCPFVRKHYDSENMQKLQLKYKGKVKWLTIVSSAKDNQGYLAGKAAATAKFKEEKMHSDYLLLDPNGKVGRAYNAKTTPHMYIINKEGKLVYEGAIDSISSYDSEDIPKSKNYVDLALTELLAGQSVKLRKTRAYGCSVKY